MKILKQLNLLDIEGNFSITNFAVIISLVITCFIPIGALLFLVAVANYCHKRYETARHYDQERKLTDVNMVSLQNQMDEVSKRLDSVNKNHDAVLKLADESKKLLSEKNLAKGFTGRVRQ